MFGAPVLYASNSPSRVAAADLDGDSRADLVVADSAGASVSVFLGARDGGFGARADYTAGGSPTALAVGLLPGDGVPDVVVAYSGSSAFGVLFGVGNGALQAPVTRSTGGGANHLILARLDSDPALDLVITHWNSSTIDVFRGTPDGGFVGTTSLGLANAHGLAVADLNGDGTPDIAATNYNAATVVSVYLGRGDGTFVLDRSYVSGGNWGSAISTGDFDRNGATDLAVANYLSESLDVLLGQGDGGFVVSPTHYTLGGRANDMVAADLDWDGTLDLAIAGYTGSVGTFHVLTGNGDGTFTAAATVQTGGQWGNGVAVGDFNGDEKLDVAIANLDSDNLSVFLNRSKPR